MWVNTADTTRTMFVSIWRNSVSPERRQASNPVHTQESEVVMFSKTKKKPMVKQTPVSALFIRGVRAHYTHHGVDCACSDDVKRFYGQML